MNDVITVNDKLESFVSKEGNKCENVVSKSDTVNNSSNSESRKLVDVSNEEVISTDELEKETRDSLNVEYEQRANFPCSIYEVNASQVLYKDKGCLLYTSRCV